MDENGAGGGAAWVSRSLLDWDWLDLACHSEALHTTVAIFLGEAKTLHGRNQMLSLRFPKQEKEASDKP